MASKSPRLVEAIQIFLTPEYFFYGHDEIKNVTELIWGTELYTDRRENTITVTADAAANTKKRLMMLSSRLYEPNKQMRPIRYSDEGEEYQAFYVVSLALFSPVFKMKCHFVGSPSTALINPKMLPQVKYTTDAY